MHTELAATYRLQLHAGFTLDAAADAVPYLADLGISHLYLSPILQAAPGSEHGYDVADPGRINEEIGGEEALGRFFEVLTKHGMAAVLDIVPNHMSTSGTNPWWWSVLQEGAGSPYAAYFDIDWTDCGANRHGKVLLPILGDHPAIILSRGEITVVPAEDAGEPLLAYQDQRFPINKAGRHLIDEGETAVSAILDRQHYRLAYWRVGAGEINYRRFFDVPTLCGVRVETPEVFEATHRKILELVANAPVDGLRVDHPDGLRDPAGYLEKLRGEVGGNWIVVEKILQPGEMLRHEWPVDGTTGYDFLQRVSGLFIDPGGEKAISDFYADFTGHIETFGALVREKKKAVIESSFTGDLERLVDLVCATCRHSSVRLDHARSQLSAAITEIAASFPVYRTYARSGAGPVGDTDREYIGQALESARRRNPEIDPDLIDFIGELLRFDRDVGSDSREFVARFQQITAPIMAKGVEDTTFYTYDRLLALNEVGCDPARFGVSAAAFHEAFSVAHRDWPRGMLTLSTHDTKRDEDVRARISLLSEIPERWAAVVRQWSDHNNPAWDGRVPDRSAEHLLYQTLVGAWPIETQRIRDYMQKACREAKTHTSWIDPDPDYERRLDEFIVAVLEDEGFLTMLGEFVTPLLEPGRTNSLAQTLIKLTAPGVADTYQGSEIWNNSLVDPDNRRRVDFEGRRRLLEEVKHLGAGEIIRRSSEGLPKMHVIRTVLALRHRRPENFREGESGVYVPALVSGAKLSHVVAFRRGSEVVVVVPRLPLQLGDSWEDTAVELEDGTWKNLFDGSRHEGHVLLADLFHVFPVALLEKIDH